MAQHPCKAHGSPLVMGGLIQRAEYGSAFVLMARRRPPSILGPTDQTMIAAVIATKRYPPQTGLTSPPFSPLSLTAAARQPFFFALARLPVVGWLQVLDCMTPPLLV